MGNTAQLQEKQDGLLSWKFKKLADRYVLNYKFYSLSTRKNYCVNFMCCEPRSFEKYPVRGNRVLATVIIDTTMSTEDTLVIEKITPVIIYLAKDRRLEREKLSKEQDAVWASKRKN